MNLVLNALKKTQSKFTSKGVIETKDNIVNYALDVESRRSMDNNVKSHIEDSFTSIDKYIDDIASTLEVEGKKLGVDVNIGDVQKKAAKIGAVLAMNPKLSIAKMGEQLANIPQSSDNMSVVKYGMDTEGALVANKVTMDIENFSGEKVNAAVHYTVVQNLLGSRQDPVAELFYPMISFDPNASGAKIEAEILKLYKGFTRTRKGAADVDPFGEVSVTKNIRAKDLFDDEKNRIYPVFEVGKNDDVLDANFKYKVTVDDETFETAGIKFGKDVNILGMGQTDKDLALGSMDEKDELDRAVKLEKVFYTLTAKDADGNDITEKFVFETKDLMFSGFTPTFENDSKDIQLMFDTKYFVINTNTTKAIDDDGNEVASQILAGLGGNYIIRLKLLITGTGNIREGRIAAYKSNLELVEIKTAHGAVLTEGDADYSKIKDVVDSIELSSYAVEAYRSLDTLKTRGYMFTSRTKSLLTVIPFKTGVMSNRPIANISGGDDNDASKLAKTISMSTHIVSRRAIQELIRYASVLRNHVISGIDPQAEVLGIGSLFVNTYYHGEPIDVKELVDSVRSSERTEDVKAALEAKIKFNVIEAYKQSSYGYALRDLNNGVEKKPTVIIGTDKIIGSILTAGEGLNIGQDFDVVVATSDLVEMEGKIFISFGVMGQQRNSAPHPLNFGQCWWTPEVTVELPMQVNGGVVNVLKTFPRYQHQSNLPILCEYNVLNLPESFGKAISYKRNV